MRVVRSRSRFSEGGGDSPEPSDRRAATPPFKHENDDATVTDQEAITRFFAARLESFAAASDVSAGRAYFHLL